MKTTPYLFFPMTCEEAIRMYAGILNLPEPQFFRFSDMPQEEQDKMPGVPAESIMNCALMQGGEMLLLASDDPSGDAQPMAGCNIHLEMPNVDEAHRVFNALAEGGNVTMPMVATFWTPAFGSVHDKYGVRWMVSAPGTDQP